MMLRKYQEEIVNACRQSYAAGARAPLVVLPTGGGKTFVFCYIARSAAERGGRVLILVHRRELIAQTSRSLAELGVRHGVIAAGQTMQLREPVQVASVQTLARRDIPWSPTLIVIDEAHHAVAGTWRKALSRWPNARVLGVTATPMRQDGAGLGAIFDDLIEGPSLAQLTDMGHLSPVRAYAPPIQVDTRGMRSSGGDWSRSDGEARARKITGGVVQHYREIMGGRSAIAFCATVAHAEHVAQELTSAGYRAVCVHGGTPTLDRDCAIAGLGSGDVQVLCSCDIISEGTDVPSVEGAILLRATRSLGLYLQQVGRVLRPAPGKSHATIIDHVGAIMRHGLPDEPREWTLDMAPARKRKGEAELPPPWLCTDCYEMGRPPTPQRCTSCGAELRKQAPPPEEADGALVELDPREVRRARAREEADARTLEDLLALAARRGYRPGWAYHRHRARQGRR